MKTNALLKSAFLLTSLALLTAAPTHAQMVPQQTTNTSTETIGGTTDTKVAQTPAAQPAPPPADERQAAPRPRFTFGPDIGLYLPTKNLVRDRFGNSWFSLGLGFGQYEVAPVSGKIGFNINFLTNKHNSNTVYLIPIGVQYRKGLTQGQSATPYVGAEADVVVSDLHSATDNVKWGVRTSGAGSLFGGIDFGKNARFEVQYIGFSDIAGYNFSGTNLVAGFPGHSRCDRGRRFWLGGGQTKKEPTVGTIGLMGTLIELPPV
jgi:hypothetical protein